MPDLVIHTESPARVKVLALGQEAPHGAKGETPNANRQSIAAPDGGAWYWPNGALRDLTASPSPGVLKMDLDPSDASRMDPGYSAHFLTDQSGEASLWVPPGPVLVTAERGPEHTPVERMVEVGVTGARVSAVPTRWVNLQEEGWFSGDLHIHRPLSDAPAILEAEDLYLGAFVTNWNQSEPSEANEPAPDRPSKVAEPYKTTEEVKPGTRESSPLTQAVDSPQTGDRSAVAPVTEDERGGGAWLLHGVAPCLPTTSQWWYPTGREIVDRARTAGAHFDAEKLTWWEVPVMMATAPPDSVGVLNNHYVPGGFFANEAWGRPRDRIAYPGHLGAAQYQLWLYYQYLNCGFVLPASAGSASGVLPAPPGYNRVYVQPGSAAMNPVVGFYAALRAGHSFVTNGPLLDFQVDDVGPGGTVRRGRAKVQITTQSTRSGSLGAVNLKQGLTTELVIDGSVAAQATGDHLKGEFDLSGARWIAARVWQEDSSTIRLAHSSPIYVAGSPISPKADYYARAANARNFFDKWVVELIAQSEADTSRFPSQPARQEVLDWYREASNFWTSTRSPVRTPEMN